MDKILHFYTQFDCILKIDSEETVIKKEKISTFSISKDYIVASFFPLDVGENFDAVINLAQSQVFCKNPFLKLIDYSDCNFLIKVSAPLEQAPKAYSLNYKKISFGGDMHEIIYSSFDTFLLCIKNSHDKLVLTNNDFIGVTTFRFSQNHLLFYSKTTKNNYILGQIDYKNKKYVKKIFKNVDIISEKQNKVTTIKNLCDFGHHAIKTTYNLKDMTFSQQLTSTNSPQVATRLELIPYAFIDAIKVKNFDLARKYLASELSNKLDDDHLSTFFGDFVECFQNIKNDASFNKISLFYGKNQVQNAKIYHFEFDGNKIVNIYEE